MLKLLLIGCTVLTCFLLQAQVPDFISVKKRNGVAVKSYYAGTEISMLTSDGRQYDALIDKVANDSIYLKYYQQEAYPNIIGTVSYDTLTTYILPIHYKHVKKILLPKVIYKNSYWGKLGKYAAWGGLGYTFLNVFNGLTAKEKPLFDARNKRNVIISTAIGAGGVYLKKKYAQPRQNPKKYKIVYVHMQ